MLRIEITIKELDGEGCVESKDVPQIVFDRIKYILNECHMDKKVLDVEVRVNSRN